MNTKWEREGRRNWEIGTEAYSLLILWWLGGEEKEKTKKSACQCRSLRRCELGLEDPLEEGVATHSSILAWRIPWTEEPGGPQSRGPQLDTTEVTWRVQSD